MWRAQGCGYDNPTCASTSASNCGSLSGMYLQEAGGCHLLQLLLGCR
jgi:hypothetical protein